MALTNAQYEEIMRGYEKKQHRNRHLVDIRLKEVLVKVPEYQEIDRSISSLCVTKTKRMLEGDKSALNGLSEQIKNYSLQRTLILQNAGFPSDYLKPIYDCPLCKDTGYVEGQKCQCFKQSIIDLLYEQSNIKDMLREENFSKLTSNYYVGDDLKRFEQAAAGSKNFIQNFNLDYHNLFFYGTVGTGKSLLSCCIAKELMDNGHSVIYFSSSKLFDRLADHTFDYRSKDELNHLYQDLFECDLLIIDDLGTELMSSFVSSSFFTCLNERHLRKHATIISTNLSLEELSHRYSERIFSRITSHFDLYKLSGPDIRMHKKRVANRK